MVESMNVQADMFEKMTDTLNNKNRELDRKELSAILKDMKDAFEVRCTYIATDSSNRFSVNYRQNQALTWNSPPIHVQIEQNNTSNSMERLSVDTQNAIEACREQAEAFCTEMIANYTAECRMRKCAESDCHELRSKLRIKLQELSFHTGMAPGKQSASDRSGSSASVGAGTDEEAQTNANNDNGSSAVGGGVEATDKAGSV